jgi:hypothetical protein
MFKPIMTMCAFGSCRVEWRKKEDKSSGPRKYCVPHSTIIAEINLKKAQAAYRKRSATAIAKRNAEWLVKNPNYQREYYLKRKAERLIKKVEL